MVTHCDIAAKFSSVNTLNTSTHSHTFTYTFRGTRAHRQVITTLKYSLYFHIGNLHSDFH